MDLADCKVEENQVIERMCVCVCVNNSDFLSIQMHNFQKT